MVGVGFPKNLSKLRDGREQLFQVIGATAVRLWVVVNV